MKFVLCLTIALLIVGVVSAERAPGKYFVDQDDSPSYLCKGEGSDTNWYRTYGISGGRATGVAVYDNNDIGDVVSSLSGNWYENGIHTSGSGTGDETLTFEFKEDLSGIYPSAYLQTNWTWSYSTDLTTEYNLQLSAGQYVDEATRVKYCMVPDLSVSPTDRLVGRWFGGNAFFGSGDVYLCRSSDSDTANVIYGSGHGLYDWYFEGETYDDGLTVLGAYWLVSDDGNSKKGDIVLRAVGQDNIEGWASLGNSYIANPTFWSSLFRVGNTQDEGTAPNWLECSVNQELKTFAADSTSGRDRRANGQPFGRPTSPPSN